jgi:hypothetical protein
MKKALPYILGLIVLALVITLVMSARKNLPKKMDERITLKKSDKIPYGTEVARKLLPELFPNARIYTDNSEPGYWDSIQATSYNQAVVFVSKNFNADDAELNRLSNFVSNGNFVFIIARDFSSDVTRYFDFSYNRSEYGFYSNQKDSMVVRLEQPMFTIARQFFYPGKNYESYFYQIDTARALVLGRNGEGYPDFIRFRKGAGAIFIHAAPMAFSNYFILHKKNSEYFEQAFSVLPPSVGSIVWSEFYLTKRAASDSEKKPNWFRALIKYPSFTWGLLTGALFLLVFVALGSRRRQRMIPVYARPKNASLDFIKTLGRLYHDRRDHLNLSRKMAAYFLEHVRSRYKLATLELDEAFVKTLHYKSGYPEQELNSIVSFIKYLDEGPPVMEHQLADFHRQLELFYQNT